MKSYRKISALSLIGILFVSSIAVALPENPEGLVKRAVKKEVASEEVLPMTYAQVGTTLEGAARLRFATPINVKEATDVTYTRSIDGMEDNVVEVKSVYKGIEADGTVYYYDGNNVTEEPVEGDYYWANYMIEFAAESSHKSTMITAKLDVDGKEAPFLTTSYNAVASADKVTATFVDENGTLLGRSVVISGDVPVYAGEALEEGYCWSDGEEYYEQLPVIEANTIFEISEKIVHQHTEEVVQGKPASCTEKGLTDGLKCSECGEVLVPQEEIPLTDHTGGVASETDYAICSICGQSYGELKNTYLGTVGDLKAYGIISDNILKMTYTTTNTSDFQISQFITFGDGVVYEVRFKEGWTGIYNWNSSSWVAWSPKVSNGTYETNGTERVISQVTDLTFFADLGVDISNPKIIVAKEISQAYLIYKDHQILSYDDKATWLTLDSKNHLFIAQKQTYLGTVGDLKAYGTIIDSNLKMTYTTTNTSDFQISQFITFGDGVIYEVRFKEGWTGIYNWNSSSWVAWSPKVSNGTYKTVDNTKVISQTTDLTFFSDLGVDISNPLLLPAKEISQAYLIYNDTNQASYNDLSTWLNVNSKDSSFTLPQYQYMGTLVSSYDGSNIEAYYMIAGHQLVTKYTIAEGKEFRLKQDLYFGGTITYRVIQESAGFTGIWNVNSNSWFTYGSKIAVATKVTENGYTTYTQVMDLTYFTDNGEADISNPILIVTNNAGVALNYKGEGALNYNDKNTWINLR